jgi:serine protease Do
MKGVEKALQSLGLVAVLAVAANLGAFEPQKPAAGGSYLGIAVVKEERGVEITRLEDDSPAAAAGLKVGDVLLRYNQRPVNSVEELIEMVRETAPGREVTLSISRGGSVQDVTVKTASRKSWAKHGSIEIPRIELPPVRIPDLPRAYMSWRSTIVGIEAESLDSQLAEYFGVKEGVLVRSVVQNSAADRAGLRAGDVIVRVDGQPVRTPREVSSAIRSEGTGKPVPLTVVRERRETTVTLSLADEDR